MLAQRLTKHSRSQRISSTMCCKTSLALSSHSSFLRKLFVAFLTMVVLSEIVHVRDLGCPLEKQVCVLRKGPNGKL